MPRHYLGVSRQRPRLIIITHVCPCISSRCLWSAAMSSFVQMAAAAR